MSTRRELLRLGGLAGVAALVPGAAWAGRSRTGAGGDGPTPTRDQLLGQLEATFLVQSEGGPIVSLVLVEVADPAFTTAGAHDAFRAIFLGPRTAPLRQDAYAAVNEALGEFPLFLVPVGRVTGRARYYEAAFNRGALG